jgi:hypothetical protein
MEKGGGTRDSLLLGVRAALGLEKEGLRRFEGFVKMDGAPDASGGFFEEGQDTGCGWRFL